MEDLTGTKPLYNPGDKVLVAMYVKDSFENYKGETTYIMAGITDDNLIHIPDNKVYISISNNICVYGDAVVKKVKSKNK